LVGGFKFKNVSRILKKCYNKSRINLIFMDFFSKKIIIALFPIFFLALGQVNFAFGQDLEIPTIITRTQWGADESIRSWEAAYPILPDGSADFQVKKIVIHHTASLQLPEDSDGTGQYKGKVRDIYRFHVFNATWEEYPGLPQRGWGDIGYHYLIDPNGNIYQGRYGGNGVMGAHVYGFNEGTVGIAILGTYGAKINGKYETREISPRTKESLEKLVGWLAAVNDINLNEKTEICGKNPKGENICKTTYGLVGHKDLGNTLCPGDDLYNILGNVREKAVSFAEIYNGHLYQEQNKKPVYKISKGVKESFSDLSSFLKQGGQYQKLITAPKTILDIFQRKILTRYPDGSLLREFNSNEIYLIEDNKKRKLEVSEEEFRKLGFDPLKIKAVSFEELDYYENGPNIKYGKNGDLLTVDGVNIYFIEDGRKRFIATHVLFAALGLRVPDVKKVSTEEILSLLDGEPMKYPDGTLLKSKDSNLVYLIDFGKKRKFWTLRQFLSLGYNWDKVSEVDSSEVANFIDGPPMRWPSGTLLRADGSPDVYLIIAGERNLIESAAEFLRRGFKWSDIITVSREELLSYPSPSGKLQSGSLVKAEDKPEVYLLEGNKLYWIKTAQDFEKRGYKWSDIITVGSDELKKYSIASAVQQQSVSGAGSTPVPTSIPPPTPTSAPTSTPQTSSPISQEPKIRIAIFSPDAGHQIKIKANDAYDVYLNEKLLVSKNSNEQTAYLLDQDVWLKFVPKNSNTIFEILSYDDRPSWKPEINYNKFRGEIDIKYSQKSKKIWVINELPLEDYLRGLAETVQGDPLEFLKAMMVSSRSYALFHLQRSGKYGADEIFHLKNTSFDQLYKGYSREEFAPDIIKATEETRGQIAVFDEKPIRALYSSGAPESTRDACKVFGGEFCDKSYDYLRGGIQNPAGASYKRTSCDSVNHCTGLMADGARYLAEQGKTWQEILLYYYKGIEIKKLY